jgi:murein DD-endopeptidase MepM/ murein hydrolase activator NlpD
MKLDLIYPTSGGMNQSFGANSQFYSNPIYGGIKGHNGIDFMTNHGWSIYASHDGIAYYEVDPSGGCGVVITSKDGSYKTIYWHLCPETDPRFKSPVVGKILPVETGDIIGYSDNTGASTGDHLHWGLKLCKNGETINKDNGYLGAVDPMPYCNKMTPEDFFKYKASLLKKIIDLATKLLQFLRQ